MHLLGRLFGPAPITLVSTNAIGGIRDPRTTTTYGRRYNGPDYDDHHGNAAEPTNGRVSPDYDALKEVLMGMLAPKPAPKALLSLNKPVRYNEFFSETLIRLLFFSFYFFENTFFPSHLLKIV